jgi:hypothetical protein
MGPIHDNFTPCWKTHLLRGGGPDEMPRDLRNSRASTDLSVLSMESLVIGENHNVLNLVFSLCMLGCLVKVQDTARTLLNYSPNKHFC